MARIAVFTEYRPRDRRESQKVWHGQGCVSGKGDALMERILRRVNSASQEEVLKRIASLAGIRRHKVLDIRRRIAEGTYDVADGLDGVVERVLEAMWSARERRPGASTCVTSLFCLAADRYTSRR